MRRRRAALAERTRRTGAGAGDGGGDDRHASAWTSLAYRTLWQENRQRVIGWARAGDRRLQPGDGGDLADLGGQLTEPGRRLLERLAFLAPDPVPEFLLDVPVPAADAEDAHAALDDLATYSLATRDPEGNAFLVHRLVQDVTRRGLDEAGMATQRLTEALGWVNAAFTGDPQDVRTWGRLDPLAPHADAVAGHADAAGIAEPTGRLMSALGTAVSCQGAVCASGTAVSPRARHRRGKLRQGPSERRDPPQQPRPVAASHQPARRGGTADAPRARHRRGKLRQGPSERRDATSTTSPSCCKPPTGSARRNR